VQIIKRDIKGRDLTYISGKMRIEFVWTGSDEWVGEVRRRFVRMVMLLMLVIRSVRCG
jgi:hypothetical protein